MTTEINSTVDITSVVEEDVTMAAEDEGVDIEDAPAAGDVAVAGKKEAARRWMCRIGGGRR